MSTSGGFSQHFAHSSQSISISDPNVILGTLRISSPPTVAMHRFLVSVLLSLGTVVFAQETCGEGECKAAPLSDYSWSVEPPIGAPPLGASPAPSDLVVALQVARQKIVHALKSNAIDLEVDSLSRDGLDPF